MQKIFITYIFLHIFFIGFSQPASYYDNAQGGNGATLKTELYQIINGHNQRSYNNLWTDFQTTDKKSNGQVWDMYSDVAGGSPSYTFSYTSDQCGTYGGEGDCYNREHSFPKSWWGGSTSAAMYTDLFHLVPTDGYVNYRRSNYPYGEVGSNVSWTGSNGSKVGYSNYPGYSSTVFEPIDAYKGDFARNYFYMATRYENVFDSWAANTDMLDGNGFSSWALNLLLDWHQQDPVSQKELDRNDDVYSIQHNRNPFIDHPEFVERIWGGDDDYAPYFYSSTPISDNISSTDFDLIVNMDEDCNVYYVVLANGATAPSVTQIKAGEDASGTLLASGLRGTITVASADINHTETISSLTSNTSYDIYVVAEDNSSNIQNNVSLLEVTLSASSGGGTGFSSYSENFDNNSYWNVGSGYSVCTYILAAPQYNDKFSSNKAVKETSDNNSAPNAFRLKNTSNAYLRYECEGTVSSFSIMAARWDNNPTPNITIRYSLNSGSTYTTINNITGSFFSSDKTYKQISHTFASAITNNPGDKIYIEFVTTTGERMLYDDFEITFGAATPAFDSESDIIIKNSWAEPTKIDYSSYSASSSLTTSNSIEVAKFTIRDGGSNFTDADTDATTLTDISFTINNFENIRALALFKGILKISELTSISASTTFSSISIAVADDGSEDISLYATFNIDAIDNENLKFTINSATADSSIGSDFAASNAGGAYTDDSGNNNKIEVSAAKLNFTINKPSSSVTIDSDFDVEVKALDANNNIDLDANNSVSLVRINGNGVLSSATGLTQSLSNGIYIWSDIKYNTAENFTIEASTLLLTNANSSTIACNTESTYMSDLIIGIYHEGSGNNKAIALYNGTGDAVNLLNYSLKKATNGGGSFGNELTFISTTLSKNSFYVIVYNSAETELKNKADLLTTSAFITFNGNDAIALYNNSSKGILIDKVGDENSNADFGKDVTLIRKTDITTGPVPTFDLNEWENYKEDYFDAFNNTNILPIDLIQFSAKTKTNYVIINWKTATEINNDYFTIERSYNAIDFEDIAQIQAAGNSNKVINYEYADLNINMNNAIYYRLKQTDFDGKFTRSEIISVNSKSKKFSLINSYGYEGDIYLNMNSDINTNALIKVLDISGRVLLSKDINLKEGLNSYKINIPNYTSGLYFIRVTNEKYEQVINSKLILK